MSSKTKLTAALLVAALGGSIGAVAVGVDAQAADTSKTDVPTGDKTFLDDSFSINEGEIRLGHLAEQNGTTEPVTSLGRRMISDHTKALDASRRVASQLHLTLPSAVDAQTQSLYDNLSKKSGRDFDTAYLDAMVSGHETALRKFEEEANTGNNAAIKSYARNELPTIRELLTLARKAQQQEQKGVTERQKR